LSRIFGRRATSAAPANPDTSAPPASDASVTDDLLATARENYLAAIEHLWLSWKGQSAADINGLVDVHEGNVLAAVSQWLDSYYHAAEQAIHEMDPEVIVTYDESFVDSVQQIEDAIAGFGEAVIGDEEDDD